MYSENNYWQINFGAGHYDGVIRGKRNDPDYPHYEKIRTNGLCILSEVIGGINISKYIGFGIYLRGNYNKDDSYVSAGITLNFGKLY
jgi:hypothetical protein